MKQNEKTQSYVSTAQDGECRDANLEWPQCKSVALPPGTRQEPKERCWVWAQDCANVPVVVVRMSVSCD